VIVKSNLLFLVAMLGCLATSEARLSACTCRLAISSCVAFENAGAVFVGQVLEITPVKPPPQRDAAVRFYARRVSFRITEGLRGGLDETVEVYTGSGGGDCGFGFTKGKSYLVYAHQEDTGQLATGTCTRTREATRGAQDEIKELRGFAQEPRKCKQS
jgi:hypothetical protein